MTTTKTAPRELNNDDMLEIYTNEKFRNQVAYAHGCSDSNGNFKYYQTCSYPERYIVTKEQIEIAKEEVERAREILLRENRNKLLFVGMGMEFNAKEGFINNHRIRTEFINDEGKTYFIEVGTARDNDKMRCDHSIDRDLQNKMDERRVKYYGLLRKEKSKSRPDQNIISDLWKSIKMYDAQPYNNYKGIERRDLGLYTYDNLLKLVNEKFNCSFKEIVIDNYNISCDGVMCESPLKTKSI